MDDKTLNEEVQSPEELQIQEEIAHLRQLDKDTANKVRASYTIISDRTRN